MTCLQSSNVSNFCTVFYVHVCENMCEVFHYTQKDYEEVEQYYRHFTVPDEKSAAPPEHLLSPHFQTHDDFGKYGSNVRKQSVLDNGLVRPHIFLNDSAISKTV